MRKLTIHNGRTFPLVNCVRRLDQMWSSVRLKFHQILEVWLSHPYHAHLTDPSLRNVSIGIIGSSGPAVPKHDQDKIAPADFACITESPALSAYHRPVAKTHSNAPNGDRHRKLFTTSAFRGCRQRKCTVYEQFLSAFCHAWPADSM